MKYFFVILFILVCLISKAQDSVQSGFKRLPININLEKKCEENQEIERKNSNIVTFSFFQDISDTVIFFINGEKVKTSFFLHDSLLVSTDHTGFDFTYEFKEIKNMVTIAYRASKSIIEFELDKRFPLYCIYFYNNNNVYVSGRKCILIIR